MTFLKKKKIKTVSNQVGVSQFPAGLPANFFPERNSGIQNEISRFRQIPRFDMPGRERIYGGTPNFDFADASLASGLSWDTSTFLIDGTISASSTAVPEPGSFALLALFGSGLILRRKRP